MPVLSAPIPPLPPSPISSALGAVSITVSQPDASFSSSAARRLEPMLTASSQPAPHSKAAAPEFPSRPCRAVPNRPSHAVARAHQHLHLRHHVLLPKPLFTLPTAPPSSAHAATSFNQVASAATKESRRKKR
ncbi:hypothetical protein M0R45_030951 [Rubus argutus]|uniref:Uncharacterized protein n=1 Tax=Rubus argutus TaxID=59490 RepID=A0AAW1WES6_RUBAR